MPILTLIIMNYITRRFIDTNKIAKAPTLTEITINQQYDGGTEYKQNISLVNN